MSRLRWLLVLAVSASLLAVPSGSMAHGPAVKAKPCAHGKIHKRVHGKMRCVKKRRGGKQPKPLGATGPSATPPASTPAANGTAAAPQPPQAAQDPPAAYKAAIGCSNGALNPPDCTDFAGGTSNLPYTNGNCLGNDGLVHLTLYFWYSNGQEWFRNADGCNNWYDEWSGPTFYQADFNYWGTQTFGPVVYCSYHRGGICG